MPSHRQSRALVMLSWAIALTVVSPMAARAAPAPLRLPADWYAITTPYRYDEAHRFAAGWHRGVDVEPEDGTVRAVTSGVVRFVGAVAGARVVTVRDQARGVVVTYVGLDAVGVRAGQTVAAGAVLGRAEQLHVGAYDSARRSRYVPITGRAAAGADGHAATGADRSMSGVIVGRLRDAALGRAAVAAPAVGAPTVADVLVAAPKAAPAVGHVAPTRRATRSIAQPAALTGLPVPATTILGMRLVTRVTQRSASGVTAAPGAAP
ncbi:MAG: M23 family metallopeptidase, partial [Thermoleophilia bacterium]|nr:M23 family metallopeptidase [Thermoleophilia bacterium]